MPCINSFGETGNGSLPAPVKFRVKSLGQRTEIGVVISKYRRTDVVWKDLTEEIHFLTPVWGCCPKLDKALKSYQPIPEADSIIHPCCSICQEINWNCSFARFFGLGLPHRLRRRTCHSPLETRTVIRSFSRMPSTFALSERYIATSFLVGSRGTQKGPFSCPRGSRMPAHKNRPPRFTCGRSFPLI